MTTVKGPAAQAARDDLIQPCPRDATHQIRPVEVNIHQGPDGEPVATLLGVCSACWPDEVTILETTVAVTREQIRGWLTTWTIGQAA